MSIACGKTVEDLRICCGRTSLPVDARVNETAGAGIPAPGSPTRGPAPHGARGYRGPAARRAYSTELRAQDPCLAPRSGVGFLELEEEPMALRIKPTADIAQKFIRVTPGRVDDYVAGVSDPTVKWQEPTVAAAGNYSEGVQQAIADKRFEEGVNRAGEGQWRDGVTGKGKDR